MIPVSRQLPEHCPRRVVIEEVTNEWGGVDWKVTIGNRSALLTFDEMLGCVAAYTRPHWLNGHPLFWSCFETDEERAYKERIMDSRAKLQNLDCLKSSDIW